MKLARALAFATALACAVLMAAASVAVAQPNPRTYTVAISPGSVTAGASTTFELVLKNTSSTRSGLESANFSPPPGFTLNRASLTEGERGTAGVERNVLKLRNIFVPQHGTLDVFVTATAPAGCTDSSGLWRSEAKPRGNFTGAEFRLGSDASRLTTIVACALRFTTEPKNAVVGQTISGSPFNPSGPALRVEIVDGKGNVVSSSSAPVTIAPGNNPGGAKLGGTNPVNAVNGVATFSDLTLDKPGHDYTLVASSPGLTGATSSPFDEVNVAASCLQGQSCFTDVFTPVSELKVTANPAGNGDTPNASTLTESVDVGTPLTCAGYRASDPNWFEFLASSVNRIKLLTYTLKDTSPEGIQACFGAPYEFRTSAGEPAPAVRLPDGTTEFEGLLPSCPARGPCVQSITSQEGTNGTDTVVTVRIPDGLPGDPRMRM